MESLGRSRPLNQGKGGMRGEIAPCYVEKFAGKDNRPFSRWYGGDGRKSEVGIS